MVHGVQALWLGNYYPWDGYDNFVIAKRNGFKSIDGHVEGSLYGYENLDNYATGPRDYLRWVKYGYGRATDIACNHVRRGRIRRDEAVALIKTHDGAFPTSYLGRSLASIVGELGLSINNFVYAADRFTNKELFTLSLGPTGAPRPTPLFEVA